MAGNEPVTERYARPEPHTHAELDTKVHGLFAVGGIYEIVAYLVERDNRPHCTGEPTRRKAPWLTTSPKSGGSLA
jgi:hypothetical protein